MAYTIQILKSAMRALAKIGDVKARLRVQVAIDRLATSPRPHGVETMAGAEAGQLRIRAGDYRILYEVEDRKLLVLVLKVGNRREVYR